MNELDTLCRTYCLRRVSVKKAFYSKVGFSLIGTVCVKLVSTTGISFVGAGKTISEMELNCAELFETHQYFYRKGLLTTKNLN